MAAKKPHSTTSLDADFSRIKIATDDDISLEKRLESFPHSFHLTDLMLITKQRREKILLKLQREPEEKKQSLMERNRDVNFISFMQFLIGDRDKAIETNLKVCRRDPTNIVARANRVRFLLKQDKRSAESELIELENLKGDSYRMRAVAEAEIAYCYARISPASYPKCVELNRKVNQKYPEEYEWKFGEGLTLRRTVSLQCHSFHPGVDIVELAVRCWKMLEEVGSKGSEPFNAMAYAELGEFATRFELRNTPFDDEIVVERFKQQTTLLSCEEYFQKALDLDKQDPFVLASCGKHFLNKNQLDDAQTLLEESFRIRPTGNAFHQLGKVLLRKAKNESNSRTFQRAIKYLKQSVDITHGDNYSAILDLASAYMNRKCYEDAEEVLNDKIQRDEIETSPFDRIAALKKMGIICFEKGKSPLLSPDEQARLRKEEINYKILAIEVSAIEVLYKYRTHFRTVTDLLNQTDVHVDYKYRGKLKMFTV